MGSSTHSVDGQDILGGSVAVERSASPVVSPMAPPSVSEGYLTQAVRRSIYTFPTERSKRFI